MLVAIVTGLGLLLLFERHVERRMVLELDAHLRQLASGIELAGDGMPRLGREPVELRFGEPLGGLYWQIGLSPSGGVLRSRSLSGETLALPADMPELGQMHVHRLSGPQGSSLLAVERRIELPAPAGGRTVRAVVAIDRAEVHAAGLAFAADLAPSLAVLAALLVAAACFQASIGLQPLGAVRHRLAQVRAKQRARLGHAFPEEIRPLAAEVDHLLDARDAAIEWARERAANLAHGLKTPLTVLRSDVEELRRKGETRIADEVESITDDMQRHIERELARARTGATGRADPLHPVRPVAERIVAALRRIPKGEDIEWEILIAPTLASPLDTQDLAEMLGNLIDNAMKWTAGRIRITGRLEPGAFVLAVDDDGPGIPESQVAMVLARGGRADQTRPGTGLGLAIVGDLAEAYGGALSVGRSDLGGLSAQIRLSDTAYQPSEAGR
jgi:signal transduction histidine kinase